MNGNYLKTVQTGKVTFFINLRIPYLPHQGNVLDDSKTVANELFCKYEILYWTLLRKRILIKILLIIR